jgi:cellulose synthase/poly-beta-1,6-N-acetylglucosamine synthase-like glycosyltransferase
VYEDWVRRKYSNRYKPWPLPSVEDRLFDASDVSIICPTIDFHDSPGNLAESVRGWISNGPGEVIFITTMPMLEKLHDIIATVDFRTTQVKCITIEHPHKRDQLVMGINESKGSILALVDDDAYWHGDKVLLNLLAPFQDTDVGLVGGPIK